MNSIKPRSYFTLREYNSNLLNELPGEIKIKLENKFRDNFQETDNILKRGARSQLGLF